MTAPGFDPLPIPLLSELPIVGAIFFSQDLLVYLTYIIPVLMWIFLYNTRFGLSLRAAGEYPAAATALRRLVRGWDPIEVDTCWTTESLPSGRSAS